MKLLLENVSNKHIEWLREMAKALNFTITEVENQDGQENRIEESETEYLLSTRENQEHLTQSLKQAEEGKTSSMDLNNLWK